MTQVNVDFLHRETYMHHMHCAEKAKTGNTARERERVTNNLKCTVYKGTYIYDTES